MASNPAFNPAIHMNPNFRFLTSEELDALDDQEQLNYNFELMTFLLELEMAGIDPNTADLENPPVEQNLPLEQNPHPLLVEDEDSDDELDEGAEEDDEDDEQKPSPSASTCKVQAGKRKRDDDFDPSCGGCQVFSSLPCILAY